MSTPHESARVSVVIPAHNAGRFITKSIESVLRQTYDNVETIVIDDASADDTAAVVERYGSRVILIRNERRRGVSFSRNAGASAASGTWLAFLDADDWWPETFLAQAVPLLERGIALCYDNLLVDDPPGTEPPAGSIAPPSLHRRALPWHQEWVDQANLAAMFDAAPVLKSIVHHGDFARVSGFDERFTGGEDFHFHVKLASLGIRLRLVDKPAGFYRVHGGQTTAAISAGRRRDPIRQVNSCREWLTMYASMPNELSLDAASREACATGRRYWGYRYIRAVVVAAVRRQRWSELTSELFVRSLASAFRVLPERVADRMRRSSDRTRANRPVMSSSAPSAAPRGTSLAKESRHDARR